MLSSPVVLPVSHRLLRLEPHLSRGQGLRRAGAVRLEPESVNGTGFLHACSCEQVQSVSQGSVLSPLSAECAREAAKTVPGEFTGIRHVRGMLSMGRMFDPDSGGSSCSRSRELTRAHPRLGLTRTAVAPPSPCCSAGRRISTASTPCLERRDGPGVTRDPEIASRRREDHL